jgi:hypothetical protein
VLLHDAAMRAVAIVVVVMLLGGLGVYVWSTGGDPPPPGSTGSNAPAPKAPAPTAPAERSAIVPTPAASSTPTALSEAVAPAPADAPAADTAGNVVVIVRDQTRQEPIAAMRWRFRGTGSVARGDGRDGRLELTLPVASTGDLRIEADGFEPWERTELAVPAATAPALEVEAFLVPAAAATGIRFVVRDPANAPIRHLRVDAFALTAANRDGAWHLGRALWSRRAKHDDGDYTLPNLAPGDYGIRIYATDDAGDPMPLLPFGRTFALTGSNGFREDVVLEPACVLTLELVDRDGAAYDPSRFGKLTLALGLPGAPATQRLWSSKAGDARASALDVLPGIGSATLEDPIASGSYLLELSVNGEPRLQRTLVLRAGEKQQERLIVP